MKQDMKTMKWSTATRRIMYSFAWAFALFFGFAVIFAILPQPATSLMAFSLPVKDVRITSLFGESRGDHFHAGLDLAIEQAVFPINSGEVLYTRTEEDPRVHRSGIGNAVVMEHAGSIRSYYYHLKDASISPSIQYAKESISSNTIIGWVGNSGYSIGSHLHLNVEDVERGLMLNPQNLFTDLNIRDNIRPRISALLFKINDKVYSLKNKRSRFVYTGELEMYAVAFDYLSRENEQLGRRSGVSELRLSIDGEVIQNYQFDYLQKDEKGLTLANGSEFNHVYGLPYNYKLGEFMSSRREHTFELYARDSSGNERRETYIVTFSN